MLAKLSNTGIRNKLKYFSPGRQALESFLHELWAKVKELGQKQDSLRSKVKELGQKQDSDDAVVSGILERCETALEYAENCLQTKKWKIVLFPSYDKAWSLLFWVEMQLMQFLSPGELKIRIAALQTRMAYVKRQEQRKDLERRLKDKLDAIEELLEGGKQETGSAGEKPKAEKEKENAIRTELQFVAKIIDGWRQMAWWKINLYKNRLLIFAGLLMLIDLVVILLLSVSGLIKFFEGPLILGFGALGGILSGLRGADALLGKTIETYYVKRREAFLRPIVGATAAMVFYAIVRSGLLTNPIVANVTENLWLFLPFGFASGFSESFFVKTLEQMTSKAARKASEESGEK